MVESNINEKKWLYEVDGMHEYKDGFLCLPECPPRVMKWMEDSLSFKESDVLLCNYSGAGIMWVQEVLWLLHHPEQIGSDRKSRESIGKRVVFIEHQWFDKDPDEILKDMPHPRLYKTHVPANFIQNQLDERKAKNIVWMADPRTSLARYFFLYNHHGPETQNFSPIEWEEFFTLFKEKQLFEGDWFEMNNSYLKYKNDPNFLFIQAEKAATDLPRTVRDIAEFLGLDLSDDTLVKISKDSPFDRVPDWSKRFTPEQLEYYDTVYKKQMIGTDLEKLY